MRHFLTSILLLLTILLPATAMAHDFVVNGIYYNIIGNNAEVSYGGDYNPNYELNNDSYTGDITIPATITYNGTTYSVTAIGVCAFERCSGLTSINIPNSVTSIGYAAFSYCSGLTSINIPNSVTAIGDEAFYCSGLTSVTIGNSVTTIGDWAFINCYRLNDVYSYITDLSKVSIRGPLFECFPHNEFNFGDRTLYVPYGTSADYQNDRNWSDYFGSIVEMDPVPAESIKLNVTTAGLNEGSTLQLTATVLPEECANKAVLWSSNDPSVATVDGNGLVTTLSVGTTTITAMTTDGSNLNASCTVTLLPVGVKGDMNGDGRVTITDVTAIIDLLLSN